MSVCDELRPRIAPFLDGELPDAAAATVASHLEACAECRAERERIAFARRALAAIPAPAPDPQAWRRLRREIRPPMSRALRRTAVRPVPLWAASAVAAGVLGLAVLALPGRTRERREEPRQGTVSRDAQVARDTGDFVRPPAVPVDGIEIRHVPDDDAVDGRPEDLDDPAPPRLDEEAASVDRPTAGAGPEGPPAPDGPGASSSPEPAPPAVAQGPDPAAPPRPASPTERVWSSVALDPESRPKELPGRPTYLPDARPFDPAVGLPLPRGEGNVPVQYADPEPTHQKRSDLWIDLGGRDRPGERFRVSRRRAENEGVQFDILIQHDEAKPERINITLTKTRPGDGDQWSVRNNTARYGKWMGEAIVVIDGNHNGRYDDTELSHQGVDAVHFVKRGAVVPLSKVLMTERGLDEFEVSENGGRFRTRPYDGPTGAVTVEDRCAGSGTYTSVLIASAGRVFDVVAAKGAEVRVPAGTYALAGGTFQSSSVRMRVLPGRYPAFEVGDDQVAAVPLGGRCDLSFRLDGQPEDGHLSVACTSVGVVGEAGEAYEPVGKGLQRVRFSLRRRIDGKLMWEQPTYVTRCPRNGYERFAVKLPNSTRAEDLKVQMFAPDYERMFGSVAGAWARD